MTKRALDKIAEGLADAIEIATGRRIAAADTFLATHPIPLTYDLHGPELVGPVCRHVMIADRKVTIAIVDGERLWLASVEGAPGFIVGGATPDEAERKVREHLPDFLAA